MRRTEALRAPRLPIGSRASSYKSSSDWLPLRPRCLVRCRLGSGKHRLRSGPAGFGGESGRTPLAWRAFSRLLWAGMAVALKGRERVVVVLRSLPLHLTGHLKLCHAESCFSDRLVCTCVWSEVPGKLGGRLSAVSFVADQVRCACVYRGFANKSSEFWPLGLDQELRRGWSRSAVQE